MSKPQTPTLRSLAIVAAVLFSATGIAAQEPTADELALVYKGMASYRLFCKNCHGDVGEGDGPVGEFLKIPPADLTQVTAENGGEFPEERIFQVIEGRRNVRGHGSEMPLWGDAFQKTEETTDPEVIRQKILALVKYVESIQEK